MALEVALLWALAPLVFYEAMRLRGSLTRCLCVCCLLGGVAAVLLISYSHRDREEVVVPRDLPLHPMSINSQVRYRYVVIMVYKL